MPIRVEWDDDAHTTLYFQIVRPWTWDEYFAGIECGQALARGSPDTVYTICDTHEAGPIPPGTITQIRKTIQTLPPNSGGTVIVGLNPLNEVIVELFRRMRIPVARRWITARTIEEARHIIDKWQQNAADARN